MSEEKKEPVAEEFPEEEAPQTEESQEEAAGTAAEDSGEQEKKARGRKKKDKNFTFTREQVEQMELAAKQLESVKDQFTRLAAEYDNFRKRTAKEKETLYQDAKIDTIREFLAVYDNLERAAAAPGEIKETIKNAILDGVIPNDYAAAYALMERLAAERGMTKKEL